MLGTFSSFQYQSDAEKHLAGLLYDENEHILSSLQLNQLASFTYHEQSVTGGRTIYEQMLDILEQVISRPMDVSFLAMHKALVILRHLLLYGAEKVLQPARTLMKYTMQIEENYNTAVIAQNATGATGFFTRMKGGSVDRGGPSREVAKNINLLLANPQTLQFERNTHADPNSLVPVGSAKRVAFITDEARLAILQRRMEQERQVVLKSNLAKSDSAFGGGYTSKDGKAVVGAAHSLEEMIKDAEKKEKAAKARFTDEPRPGEQQQHPAFSAYHAPSLLESNSMMQQQQQQPPPPPPATEDLLSMQTPASATGQPSYSAANDLLSFAAAPSPPPAPAMSTDLLGGPTPAAVGSSNGNMGGYGGGGLLDGGLGGGGLLEGGLATSTLQPGLQQQQQQSHNLQQQQQVQPPQQQSQQQLQLELQQQQQQQRQLELDLQQQQLQLQMQQLQLQQQQLLQKQQELQQKPHQPQQNGRPQQQQTNSSNDLLSPTGLDTGLSVATNSMTASALNPPSQDRFAALDALAAPLPAGAHGMKQTHAQHQIGMQQSEQRMLTMNPPASSSLDALAGLTASSLSSISHPAPAAQAPVLHTASTASSLRVSSAAPGGSLYQHHAGDDGDDEDSSGGFVMGGAVGAGLEPMGPAPAAPPPPPP